MSRGERGSVMVLAIFILVLLTGMGISLLFLTQTELRMNRAEMRFKKAFYLAESGVDDGRLTLQQANGASFDLDDDLQAAAGLNTDIDFNVKTLSLIYDSDDRLVGVTGYGDDVPLRGLTSFGSGKDEGWYMAFLTNDPVETRINKNDSNGAVMITAVGAIKGKSSEIVQAIVEPEALLISPPQAAITFLGPTPSFDDGNHPLMEYYGDDCYGGGTPGLYFPTVGAIGSSAADDVRLSIGSSTYEAGGLSPAQTIADLTDATEPAVAFPIDAGWSDCLTVKGMIEGIRAVADVVCTSPSCTLPPTAPDRVIFADTDFDLGTGEGLAIVTGELTLSANPNWNGMIFAIGEGRVVRNSVGTGVISGAMIVADIAGPDGIYGNADDCTGGSGGFASPEFVTNGSGKSTITYCAADIANATPIGPFQVVDFMQY